MNNENNDSVKTCAQRPKQQSYIYRKLFGFLPFLLVVLFAISAVTVVGIDNCYNSIMAENSSQNNLENPIDYKEAKSIYEFSAKDLKGEVVSLEKYRGHVCIILNVASQCGYTESNYKELVELYNEYSETKGLRILAFPSNQFMGQEPGDAKEICEFVRSKNVTFDVFDKINVNGDDAHPLWKYLKYKQGGFLASFIKWNFTKFIIDKNGQPVERHGPSTSPKDLVKFLEKYW